MSKYHISDSDEEYSDDYSDYDEYLGEGEPMGNEIKEMKKPKIDLSDDESGDLSETDSGEDKDDQDDKEDKEDGEVELLDVIDAEEPEPEIKDFTVLEEETKYNREVFIVEPDKRQTSNILSTYERTEIKSIRGTQIAQFNNAMVDYGNLSDPVAIAELELNSRMCPLMLRRSLGEIKNPKTGQMELWAEDWNPNEMMFI
jgi:hypothetical protein